MEGKPPIAAGSQQQTRKRLRKNLNSSLNMLQQRSMSVETIDLTKREKHPHVEDTRAHSSGKSLGAHVKRLKTEDLDESAENLRRRSQPHRAARYTESYVGPDGVLLSEEEKKPNGECSSSDSSSSDSDCEIIPLPPPPPISQEEQVKWEKRVQVLQKELRDEEIKLLLLRKLKQSQMTKDEKEPRHSPALATSLNLTHRVASRPQKKPQVTSTSDSPSKKLMPAVRYYPQSKPQDLTIDVKPTPPPAPVIDKIMNLTHHSENLVKPSITIQPITPQSSSSNSQKRTNSLSVPNEMSVTLVNPTSQQEKAAKEMSAQHQAAAKLALRKQLEKTLLQIPPPKPPVPELHFLPNGNSPEFICLLGLDIVVDFLTKMKPLSSLSREPYSCAQCKTNFTTLWKFVEKGKTHRRKVVICQSCFSTNSKKSLKVEHTSRLKTAFVKALQQEKEIERLSHSFSITPTVTTTASATFAPVAPAHSAHSSSSSAHYNKLTSLPQSSSSSTSTSSRTIASSQNMFQANNLLMQQFSKLTPQQLQLILQAQAQTLMAANMPLPAHMVPLSPFLPQYPFHLLGKSSSQSELQRQYLLDMIPPCAPSKRKT